MLWRVTLGGSFGAAEAGGHKDVEADRWNVSGDGLVYFTVDKRETENPVTATKAAYPLALIRSIELIEKPA